MSAHVTTKNKQTYIHTCNKCIYIYDMWICTWSSLHTINKETAWRYIVGTMVHAMSLEIRKNLGTRQSDEGAELAKSLGMSGDAELEKLWDDNLGFHQAQ